MRGNKMISICNLRVLDIYCYNQEAWRAGRTLLILLKNIKTQLLP